MEAPKIINKFNLVLSKNGPHYLKYKFNPKEADHMRYRIGKSVLSPENLITYP